MFRGCTWKVLYFLNPLWRRIKQNLSENMKTKGAQMLTLLIMSQNIWEPAHWITILPLYHPTGVDHRADLCCLCHNGQRQHLTHHAASPPSCRSGASERGAEGQGSPPQWLPVPWRRTEAGHHREPQVPGLCHQRGAETLYTCLRGLPNRHADLWTWRELPKDISKQKMLLLMYPPCVI